MKMSSICSVGIPAEHHKSNDNCDKLEHEKEHDIGYDHLPILFDSVLLAPLQGLGSNQLSFKFSVKIQ